MSRFSVLVTHSVIYISYFYHWDDNRDDIKNNFNNLKTKIRAQKNCKLIQNVREMLYNDILLLVVKYSKKSNLSSKFKLESITKKSNLNDMFKLELITINFYNLF